MSVRKKSYTMKTALIRLLACAVALAWACPVSAGIFQFQTTFDSGLSGSPFGVAVDGSGGIYVTNNVASSQIAVFDPQHNYLRSISGGSLGWSAGVAVTSGGTIYALNGNKGNVQTFAFDGTPGLSFGTLSTTRGMTTDKDSQLYVADTGNNRIVKFDAGGNQLAVITPPGPDTFHSPYGVAVDKSGNLYVADTFADRVMVFDSAGSLLRSFPTTVAGWPDAAHPKELAVGDDGTIYMSLGDPGLAAFTSTGTLLDTYLGSGGGTFDRASGVAIYGNTLYAVDLGHNRVQVFAVPEPATLALLGAGACFWLIAVARKRR
jgi:DNA-binding beta-propeller fold protein YncE